MLSFIRSMVVKTIEQTFSLGQDNETMSLLNLQDLIRYKEKYKFLHVGLVQVAFKPLDLLGMNASIQATLTDARCLD